MTYATTFSGIGGWELGLNACGWDLKWQCENEPYCRRLLKERFGVPIYDDIKTICEQQPEPIDALIGSPPCQPFSVAGEKRGTSDERHLFPAFIDLVSHLKPRWVLMEQVPAILTNDGGRAFGQYIGGLAALGFDCVWHCIPACAVGAPHRRDRLWIVANCQNNRAGRGKQQSQSSKKAGDVADPNEQGPQGHGRLRECPSELFARASRWANENEWLTESGICRVSHGIPHRAHRLKGLGNSVVPQIPYLIGQAINQTEKTLPRGLESLKEGQTERMRGR